jgi:hypothetical protein
MKLTKHEVNLQVMVRKTNMFILFLTLKKHNYQVVFKGHNNNNM